MGAKGAVHVKDDEEMRWKVQAKVWEGKLPLQSDSESWKLKHLLDALSAGESRRLSLVPEAGKIQPN